MTNLGIIICWSTTEEDKEKYKKELIKRYTEEFGNLENFLEKNLLEWEEVSGFKLKS